MSDNLLQADRDGKPAFYYHPLTRVPLRPHRMTINMATGELIDEPQPAPKLTFRDSLTARDVVNYYYTAVGNVNAAYVKRDEGSVKYLVRSFGLDKALFAIDALVNEYTDGERRERHAPDLIRASDYLSEAEDRMGEVAAIARQYHVHSA